MQLHEITLSSPNLWVSSGSPSGLVQHEECNLGQSTHSIHCKAIYYRVPLQQQPLSAKKYTGLKLNGDSSKHTQNNLRIKDTHTNTCIEMYTYYIQLGQKANLLHL